MSKKWKKVATQFLAAGDVPNHFRFSGASENFEIQAEASPGPAGKKLPTFSMTAYTGVPMRLAGFYHPVIIDLATATIPAQRSPILRAHDPERPIGHSTSITIAGNRINAAGVLSGENDHSADVVRLAANGFPWQASVGGDAKRMEFVGKDSQVSVNGRMWDGPLLVARGAEIREISLVAVGADGQTSAAVAAQFQGAVMNEFQQWLQARGMEEAKLPAEAVTALKAAFDAEKKLAPAPEKKPPAPELPTEAQIKAAFDTIKADVQKQAAAELGRQQAIGKICASAADTEIEVGEGDKKTKVNLQQHAISAGWTAEQTELHVLKLEKLRAGRASGPFGYVVNEPQLTEAVLEAAVLQAGNCQLENDEFYEERNHHAPTGKQLRVPAKYKREIQASMKSRYTDQVQQAAHTHFRGHIGLQQVLHAGAAMNGKRIPEVLRDNDDVLTALRANNWSMGKRVGLDFKADGATVASIANVLANVQNKFLLQGYLFAEMIWRNICGIRSTKDFKPTKAISIFGDTEFDNLGPDGEIKGGAIADQAFPNQVQTRARMLAITREHMINDDIGALTQLPAILGRGGNLKINKIFWTKWLDANVKDDGGSTAFWATTHTIPAQLGNANLISGGSSALSITSLQTAVQTYDKQVDPYGNPLGIDLEILLYPPELDETAWALLNSTLVVYAGSGSAAKQPGANRWVNRFTPQKSRYLSNSSYTGFSTTAWWLLANPNVIPTIEMAFLNGQELPFIQTAEAEFDKLGMQMRGFFDIGVNEQNFRGGIKSAGA